MKFRIHAYRVGLLCGLGLPGDHEPHGCECAGVPTLRTAPATLLQHLLHLVCARGNQPRINPTADD